MFRSQMIITASNIITIIMHQLIKTVIVSDTFSYSKW